MSLKKKLLNNDVLAVSIGVVYLWFGVLKFFPELSPAEDLARNTISVLTFHTIPSNISIVLLAILESVLGVIFIMNVYRRTAITIAFIHMAFTFTPFLLFTDLTFSSAPFCLTLLGQYIAKNIIIIAALIALRNMHKSRLVRINS